MLNLDFEWVNTKTQAMLKAYVGVPATRNADIGFADYCEYERIAGCGGPDSYRGAIVTTASLSVWLDTTDPPAEIKHVTLHEALHALAAIHHRPSPLSIMNRGGQLRLSEMDDLDEAMLRLYGHPLVRPGMTKAQVEGLIVFANELLDPPPAVEENGVQLAKRAYAAFVEAGSARFRVQGGWAGSRGCSKHTFAGSHAIGEFGNGNPNIVHFDSTARSIFFRCSESAGWRYWRQTHGAWQETTIGAIYDETNWRDGFTDAVDMLISVIRYAGAGAIAVTRGPSGQAEMSVTLNNALVLPLLWASSATLQVSITLDTQTYKISRYEMHWQFDVASRNSCSAYDVRATNGEYGVEIPIPDAIAAAG